MSDPGYFTASKSGWYAMEMRSGGFAVIEACCICGSPDIVYHNYRDLPFCQRCGRPAVPDAVETAASPRRKGSAGDAMSDDPIGDALRAEADEARAEIRAAGIVCPSCGANMADLPQDHKLVLDPGGIDWERAVKRPPTALCGSGKPVNLDDASFETWQAAANVSLYDNFRARFDETVSSQIIGAGPPRLTGILDVIGDG